MATTETKVCSSCKQEKPATEFHASARTKDGLKGECKACVSAYQRRRWRENGRSLKQERRENRRREQAELAWYREHYPQPGKPWLDGGN